MQQRPSTSGILTVCPRNVCERARDWYARMVQQQQHQVSCRSLAWPILLQSQAATATPPTGLCPNLCPLPRKV